MAKYKPITDVRYLVVHCAATPPNMDIGAKDIDLWHRRNGWFMIGYHNVIRRNGTIEAGRPLDRPGAHAQGFNEISLGVCLVGGVKSLPEAEPENNFTAEQFNSLEQLLRQWKHMHPQAQIVGHSSLPSPHARLKACPSFDVQAWLKTVGLD